MSTDMIRFVIKDRKDKELANMSFNRQLFETKMNVNDFIEVLRKKCTKLGKYLSLINIENIYQNI